MKITIQVLILTFFLSNCQTAKKQALINETINQNCAVEFASENLEKIVEFLKAEDYSSKSRMLNEDFQISYKDWKTFEDVEKITYQNCKYLEINFEKNTPINGNYYPKFRIIEICFDSEESAKDYLNKFNRIIKHREKNYGYALRNGNRLVYCQTGVTMYGFIINDFKKYFEKIIKN